MLATPEALPGFWIFMYRVSPFTYLVSAVLSTGLARTNVKCSSIELLHIPPPAGQTCSRYLSAYVDMANSALINPDATSDCKVCALSKTDQYLAQVNIYFSERWRNVGILFAYVGFNAVAAVFLYWLVRVPKKPTRKNKTE